MNRKFGMFVVRSSYLFIFWTLLSGKLGFFHLAIGFICASAIAFHSLAANPVALPFHDLTKFPGILWRGSIYGGWLLWQIILAAIHVSKLILRPGMAIAPGVIEHKTILKDDFEKVLFAQSITLTPGTITADLQGDTLIIHRLDGASSGGITDHTMENEISKIFKGRGELR